MRLLPFALVLSTGCAALPSPAPQVGRRPTYDLFPLPGALDITAGARLVDDGDAWGELDQQPAFSISITQEDPSGWFGIEGSFSYAFEEENTPLGGGGGNTQIESRWYEGSLGLARTFRLGASPWRFFVGGGAAYADIDFEGVQGGGAFASSSGSFGFYARGGLRYAIATGHVGLEYRRFEGDVESAGPIDFDTDYDQISVIFGTSL